MGMGVASSQHGKNILGKEDVDIFNSTDESPCKVVTANIIKHINYGSIFTYQMEGGFFSCLGNEVIF